MSDENYYEVNFDGIPGPTHLYSGLAHGNLASFDSDGQVSNPKQAALQSLEKIYTVYKLGIKQAVIPPQRKPHIIHLKTFEIEKGDLLTNLKAFYEEDIKSFAGIFSSSSMWTANAATVSPSIDCHNAKLNLTIANLKSNFHRSLECFVTYEFFRKNFSATGITINSPLATINPDEGAANHLRFCESHGLEGLELFVFGFSNVEDLQKTFKYKARQSKEAFAEIIKKHEVKNSLLCFQNPEAIDAGVFHNDVISTANENLFFFHEKTFYNQNKTIEEINSAYYKITGKHLCLVEVSQKEINLSEVVRTYLFNSQILSLPNSDAMMLIAPIECQRSEVVNDYIKKMLADYKNPIEKVQYLDLTQSMKNGGGPACLRLRIVMNDSQLQAINQKLIFNEDLYQKLKQLISTYYPDSLSLKDLLSQKTLDKIEICFDKYEELFAL